MDHRKAIKKVIRYFQRIKDFMLIYSNNDDLKIVKYFDYDFAGSPNDMKSTSG